MVQSRWVQRSELVFGVQSGCGLNLHLMGRQTQDAWTLPSKGKARQGEGSSMQNQPLEYLNEVQSGKTLLRMYACPPSFL